MAELCQACQYRTSLYETHLFFFIFFKIRAPYVQFSLGMSCKCPNVRLTCGSATHTPDWALRRGRMKHSFLFRINTYDFPNRGLLFKFYFANTKISEYLRIIIRTFKHSSTFNTLIPFHVPHHIVFLVPRLLRLKVVTLFDLNCIVIITEDS